MRTAKDLRDVLPQRHEEIMTETRRDETQASLIMAVAVSAALALGCTSAAPSAAADGEKLVVLAEAAEERPALRTADAVVRLGPRSAALDGRPLFSGPRVALAGSGPRPLVDLVAPPARSAAEVLAFTRSLVEAGATVRLVVSRDGERGGIARFSPETLGPPDPAAVHVWLELGEEDLVRTSEGALIPADDARALRDALLDQRQQRPEDHALSFDLGPAVSYRRWASALGVAAATGFDAPSLVAAGALRNLEALPDRSALCVGDLRAPPPGAYARAANAHPPRRSEVALVSVGVEGALDEARVRDSFRAHAEELRTCHERAPRAPAGTLRLRLRVDAAGAVRSIHQGHFTLAHPEMIRCVQAAIFAWRLPSAGAPGAAELELAFRPDWSPAADP